MAAVTVHSDFGAPKNKICHCFHLFPIHLLWSDRIRSHELSFFNVEFQARFFTLLFHTHQEALLFLFAFCHYGGIISVSKVVGISPSSLDSSLWFIQPSILNNVICISVKQAGWQYTTFMYYFPNFEPFSCSMSSSNCCFLIHIQISQETGKVVWHSYF